jgi:hypothetical protein
MKALMESDTGTIRQWDDLFYEAFALRDFHHMNVNYTDNGVEVEQIGENDCAKAIVQAHAAVVCYFVEIVSLFYFLLLLVNLSHE